MVTAIGGFLFHRSLPSHFSSRLLWFLNSTAQAIAAGKGALLARATQHEEDLNIEIGKEIHSVDI